MIVNSDEFTKRNSVDSGLRDKPAGVQQAKSDYVVHTVAMTTDLGAVRRSARRERR